MNFYIQLGNIFNKNFRLQADSTWRQLSNRDEDLDEEIDFLTSDIYELIKLQQVNTSITINSNVYKVNYGGVFTGLEISNMLYYSIYLKRDFSPLLPSKDQLISIIKHGDPRCYSTLVLNLLGLFELHPYVNSSIKNPLTAFTLGDFPPGIGDIGEEAAEMESTITRLYELSLKGWIKHLKTGKTNISNYSDLSTEEILKEIKKLQYQWGVD